MTTFVFRNQTVEAFLGDSGMTFSGYGDISRIPGDVDRYIWFYQVPVNADSAQLAQEVTAYSDQLDLVLSAADPSKPFIIFSLVNLFPLRLTGDEVAVADAVSAFNDHAMRLSRERAGVKWVDFGEFTSRYDAETLVNWKYYLMSQTLLNPRLARDFQAWWQRLEDEMPVAMMRSVPAMRESPMPASGPMSATFMEEMDEVSNSSLFAFSSSIAARTASMASRWAGTIPARPTTCGRKPCRNSRRLA